MPWLKSRGPESRLPPRRERSIVKRIVPTWVTSFVLLLACGALCQSERPSAGLLLGDRSNSPEVQGKEMRTGRPLPDAPSSVQPATLAEKFQTFAYEAPQGSHQKRPTVVTSKPANESGLGLVCFTLPPPEEASLFSCANSVDHI